MRISSKPVLVVDSDFQSRVDLCQLLEDENLTVIAADSASDAIRELWKRTVHTDRLPTFAAVFIDWDLMGNTGIHLIDEIRSRPEFSELPILVTDTAFNEKRREAMRPYHLAGYFQKPLERESLMTGLERVYRR